MSEAQLQDRMTLSASIMDGKETVTMSAPMHSLEEVLETIERFIRASGYCPEGQLNFVNEETTP